jgi:hypothetical protein
MIVALGTTVDCIDDRIVVAVALIMNRLLLLLLRLEIRDCCFIIYITVSIDCIDYDTSIDVERNDGYWR